MWIIGPGGFTSLVQDNANPDFLRARARRREHLLDSFPFLQDGDLVDLGPDAPDYRWHCSVPRVQAAQAIYDAVLNDVTYESHVKEAVAGDDPVFYQALLSCWTALRRLQEPDRPAVGSWRQPTFDPAWRDDWDSEREYIGATRLSQQAFADTRVDLGAEIVAGVDKLAERMVAAGFGDDVSDDLPAHEPLPVTVVTTAWLLDDDVDQADRVCIVCGDDFEAGNKIVTLPEDAAYGDPEAPAHVRCAEDEGWTVQS
jgi:hypothetical protein